MDLKFANKNLEILAKTEYKQLPKNLKKQINRAILLKYQLFCNFVMVSKELKNLNTKGYNLENLKQGKFKGLKSIRLNKQYRVIFSYEASTNTIEIKEISKHYE